jgi:hypothetical protein
MSAAAHITHGGCPTRHALVALRVPGPVPDARAAGRLVRWPCPHCGEEHATLDTLGRPDDGSVEVDVDLAPAIAVDIAPEAPQEAQEPSPAARPTRRASQELRNALPAADTPAGDVAKALGYASAQALVKRLDRAPELAIITRGGKGRMTVIRRRS